MSNSRGRKRDYYEVLGVGKDASDSDLKRAFRDLARTHHPDLNQGDGEAENRFKEINEAYAVLSNPRARSRYDRFGFSAVKNHDIQGTGGFNSVVEAVDDILGDIIGDAWRKRRQRKRGRDLRYTLELTFEEAVFGCRKTIGVPGSGAAQSGSDSGAGSDSGRTRSFTVTIPPGTKEGAVKMIKGEGEPGIAGGAAGDLHVIVRIREHPIFRREGHDVWCEVPISFAQAALGAIIEVPTVDAKVRMRVPEGAQSGRVFRLRGKGIPKSASKNALRGDQLVKVIVETPTGLTARQRELLEQFAQETGETVAHPRKKGFLDALKEIFHE